MNTQGKMYRMLLELSKKFQLPRVADGYDDIDDMLDHSSLEQ